MGNINKDNIKYICVRLWKEIVYLIVTIIYLFFLNNFNHILLSQFDSDDYFNILFYNGYQTIIYFVLAIILVLFGIGIIIYRYRNIKYNSLEAEDILLEMISIVIIIILICFIFVFIDNPILRAVISGFIVLGGLICSSQ